MKKFDIIIAAAVIAVAAVLYFGGILSPKEEGAVAVVYVDGKEYQRLPLNTDTEVSIKTEYGVNVVSVSEGYADCTEADCKDKLCVHQRKINKVNETIVCLPNKMVIEVEGTKASTIDAVSE